MQQFCLGRGLAAGELVSEIGGGMNLRRKKFETVMDDIEAGRFGTLVIAHKNRLARFGFDYLEHVAGKAGCEIVVASQGMVEDLPAVVHLFSCRLFGLCRYEKTLKTELKASKPSKAGKSAGGGVQ